MTVFMPSLQGGGSSVPSLVDAILIASDEAPTVATIVTGSLDSEDIPGNSLIIAALAARDNDTEHVVWTDPTLSGLSISGGWTKREVVIQDTNTTRFISAAVQMARAASSPGTGTITFNATGSCYSLLYNLFVISEGFDTDIANFPFITNSVEAVSMALNLASAPAASSLLFSWAAMNGTPAGLFTPPLGMTGFTPITQGTALTGKGARKLLSGNQNNSWTGLDSGDATAGVLVEVPQL